MLNDAEGAILDPDLNATAEAELCKGSRATVGGGRPFGGLRDSRLPVVRPWGNVGMLEDAESVCMGLDGAAETELALACGGRPAAAVRGRGRARNDAGLFLAGTILGHISMRPCR
jgi:hypothetical protein